MAVALDEATIYEPGALVRCGPPLPDDAVTLTEPAIVVEVLSPSTRASDAGAKLADYVRLPSLRHYLIVKTETRSEIHHARLADGTIVARIVRGGPIVLDPRRITLAPLFAAGT